MSESNLLVSPINEVENEKQVDTVTQEKYLRDLTKTFVGLEKPLKGQIMVENLQQLIDELHKAFSYDHVNIEYVNHLMLSYKSNPKEWRKYAKFDRYRYTRNLVDAGNGKFNLMILCWGEGHGSAIHDHADSHCFMKMLQGELCEIRFAWPNEKSININSGADIGTMITNDDDETTYSQDELQEIGRSKLETNMVAYINDNLGLHRVENPSHTDTAVSLHLYCPPFEDCSIFNKQSGKRTKCAVTFWSKFGERCEKIN